MKIHYLFGLIFTFSLLSCSKDFYFKRDQAALSKEMKDMVRIDQAVRHYNILVDQRFGIRTAPAVWDSLQTEGAPMDAVKVGELPPVKIQLAKLTPAHREKYEQAEKAGDDLMEYTHQQHRDRLYDIIKKYGYPSYDTRPWSNDSLRTGVGVVLTHFEYTDEKGRKLLDLMIKEYDKGRANESDMDYFIWHVNWRKGRPGDINLKQWIANYKKNGLPPFKPY